jgi:membrane associated rhomboid family serine protease
VNFRPGYGGSVRADGVFPIFIFPLFIPVSALLFGFGWLALQVLQGTTESFAPDMAGGIAWWAHIGGLVFGALFAVIAHGLDSAGL